MWYEMCGEKKTKRTMPIDTTSQYVLNSVRLMVRLHWQRSAEAKRSEVIHFQRELVIWGDMSDSDRQQCNTASIKLSSVTHTRAVTWCGDLERLYSGNCAPIHTSTTAAIHTTGRFTAIRKFCYCTSHALCMMRLTVGNPCHLTTNGTLAWETKMFIKWKSKVLGTKYKVNKQISLPLKWT